MSKILLEIFLWFVPSKDRRFQLRQERIRNYVMRKFFRGPLKVQSGNFEGMNYIDKSCCSSLFPKLVGSYEQPIQQWVKEIKNRNYGSIINIGCAEGYYAVGFAHKGFAKRILAYDVNPEAIQFAKQLASMNTLAGELIFKSLCDIPELRREARRGTLIFSDIEGCEKELLDPVQCPELKDTDMIIESHDCFVDGITNLLIERFQKTHKIEVSGDSERSRADYPLTRNLSSRKDARLLFNEERPKGLIWLRLTAFSNKAAA